MGIIWKELKFTNYTYPLISKFNMDPKVILIETNYMYNEVVSGLVKRSSPNRGKNGLPKEEI